VAQIPEDQTRPLVIGLVVTSSVDKAMGRRGARTLTAREGWT
jgi:hypothetical protein